MRVTANDVDHADPRWSPDGTKLIYSGGNIDENGQDVFLVTLGQPEVTTLTAPGVNDTFAEWSPVRASSQTRAGDTERAGA